MKGLESFSHGSFDLNSLPEIDILLGRNRVNITADFSLSILGKDNSIMRNQAQTQKERSLKALRIQNKSNEIEAASLFS